MPSALVPQMTLVAAARHELWRHLPAWMFFIYGQLLHNAVLTNFEPPKTELAYTVIFPMSVFVLYQVVRFIHGDASRRLLLVSLALATVLPTLTYFVHTPSPLERDTLLRIYEWSNFVWAALLMFNLWWQHRSHLILFFGVAFLYGMVLENGGILLGFFHETNLTETMVKPFVAPFATMVGWSVVLTMATFVVWELRLRLPWLRRSALSSGVLVGVFATFLDLQIDPIATGIGCWVWHESLPGWFHGVPLVNFIAWLCALVPFGYVMFRLQDIRGITDRAPWGRRDLVSLLAWSPAGLVLAAVAFIAATLIIEGSDGASWTLLKVFSHQLLIATLG